MSDDDIVARLRSNLVSQIYEAAFVIEQLRREISGLRKDDLVGRLCNLAFDLSSDEDLKDVNDLTVIWEAGVEIERLRAELRTYTGDKHTTREPFTPEAL